MFNPAQFYEAGRLRNELLMKIDTQITGGTLSNQFKLSFAAVNFQSVVIDWGDGTQLATSTYNDTSLTHTYPSPGIYNIKIVGKGYSLHYASNTDVKKILEIFDWGNNTLINNAFQSATSLVLSNVKGKPLLPSGTALGGAFRGTSNLTIINGINNWDISKVVNLNSTFYNSAFDTPIPDWDVSNILVMDGCFRNCPFSHDISTWNFNKNVTLSSFMLGKTSANYNASYYDALLQKWVQCFIGTGRTNTNKSIHMGTIKYTSAGKPYRDALVADGWTITDGGMI